MESNEWTRKIAEIDFRELIGAAKLITGLYFEFEKKEVAKNKYNKLYVELESENLTEQAGPFKNLYKDFRVNTFGSEYSQE